MSSAFSMTRGDAAPPSTLGSHTGKPATSSYAPWPDVPDVRRRTMSAIRSRDTKVELAVRRMLHREGYRYVVGRRVAGYRPDLLFTCRRKAIFVHGCFWHGHDCARGARAPKTNADYWRAKIARNRARDEKTLAAYSAMGWRALVVHECELRDEVTLGARLEKALRLQ